MPSVGSALVRVTVLVAAAVAALGGCSSPSGPPRAASGSDGELGGTLTVLAAASLTGVLEQVAAEFEDEHPRVDVVLSFGASSALAQQVVAGAPADLLAVASPTALRPVTDAGVTRGDPVLFARNAIALAVPAGNPGSVTGLADLADPELAVALCEPQVPCGQAADEALSRADVVARPDTLERDVRAVLTRIRLGEVDAGIVYRTDVVAAAPDVQEIDLPEAHRVSTRYPVVRLADSPNEPAADAFTELLLSPQVREVLTGAGFDGP